MALIRFPHWRGHPAHSSVPFFSIPVSFSSLFFSPLPSARQHPSYGDCLEVKREYYQNCSVLGCVTHYSQSAAYSCEQFLQVQQIAFVTLGPLAYAMHRGGCLELYYCNMVECPGGIQALSERPTGFLQCFDTVGLVI